MAFHGEVEFKTEMPSNVVKFGRLPEYILSFKDELLPVSGVGELVEKVKAIDASIPRTVKSAHVKKLKRKHGNNEKR